MSKKEACEHSTDAVTEDEPVQRYKNPPLKSPVLIRDVVQSKKNPAGAETLMHVVVADKTRLA